MFQLEKISVRYDHGRERVMLLLIFILYQCVTIAIMVFIRLILGMFNVSNTVTTGHLFVVLAIVSRRNLSILKSSLFFAAKSRMDLINKSLEEDQSNSLTKLNVLFILQSKCGDAMMLINKCLAFNMILNIFEFGFHITMIWFSFYNLVTTDSTLESKINFLADINLIMPDGIYVITIFFILSRLKDEMIRSLMFIHDKSSRMDNEPAMSRLLQTSAQQIQDRLPLFSCGLFTFDWELLFATLSGCFAYVIILVQFENGFGGGV